MKRKITYLILLITTLLIVAAVAVQYPKYFIDHKDNYKNFSLYSNEYLEIDSDVKATLDSVQSNLDLSAFNNVDHRYELYFIRGSGYEKLLRILGRKNIAFSKFEKHIYAATPDFKKGTLSRNNNTYEWLNLVQIISHEAIHTQMYDDYYSGYKMITPSWINEGYCEYISHIPIRKKENYSLNNAFNNYVDQNKDWVKTEYGSMTPNFYLRSRLIMEYLIDQKGMTIKEIISDKTISPEDTFRELEDFLKVSNER